MTREEYILQRLKEDIAELNMINATKTVMHNDKIDDDVKKFLAKSEDVKK